jgi:YD repeat-containing protein
MRRNLIAIALATASALPILCRAQGTEQINKMIPKPVLSSPNAAGLGKFGDYQVSHFTGIPDISIPIFEAKSGSLSVPIVLSYHASGFRPTDIASWVGMGWSISAGGQITRQVNGKPDEEFYLDHPLNPSPDVCSDLQYLRSAADGTYDTEPDVFGYSYPGRSGKFLLPNGGTYVNPGGTSANGGAYLVPYAPILVKRLGHYKYHITDENGVLYRFGTNYQGTTSTESSSSTNGTASSLNATTVWNLMDIVAPNAADSISFKYQHVGVVQRKDISYTYLFYDQCDASNGATCPAPEPLIPKKIDHINDVNQEGFQEIIFETGKIKFFLGSSPRVDAKNLKYLDRIEVYSNDSAIPVKTIQFIYSYFTNADAEKAALKLDAIHFLDNVKLPVQKYKFTYFTNSFSWKPSESNFLNARDLWGYYNGALQNTDLMMPKTVGYQQTINSPPQNVTIGGAYNRSVDTTYAKEGVLKRIDFPTGGYTQFAYEQNKYIKDDNGTPIVTFAGGLRVTKITSLEGSSGIPVVKEYKYGSGASGTGTALFMSNFFNNSSAQLNSAGCEVHNSSLSFQIRTYHSYASYVIESASPVVYPMVTEYFGNPTGANNGKIVYNYDVGGADVNHILPASTKYYTNMNAWRRGKLTRKTVYDNVGNKLSSSSIEYDTYKEDSKLVGIGSYLFMGGVNTCFGPSCQAAGSGEWVNPQTFKTATYTQNSGVLLESKTIDSVFQRGQPGKYTVNTVEKTYHLDKLQLITATSMSSNSTEQLVTINTYPFQLTANSSSTGAARGVYLLTTKNILTSPLETYSYLQKPDNTNRRVVSGQVTTFKQHPGNSKYVVADQIYVWESANRVLVYTPIAINGANNGVTFNTNQKPRVSLQEYDNYGNIQTVSKLNDVLVSYKWGYGNSLPIAEITNTLQKNVFCEGFEDAQSAFSYGGKTGKKSSANAVYSKPLSLLDPGSYILAYYKWVSPVWQYTETEVIVPSNGLYTINLPAAQYDEIRFYPKSAQLKTYTYDPLLGITSMTDANGSATYYNYDSFGRLKAIKDNSDHIVKTYDYLYKVMN